MPSTGCCTGDQEGDRGTEKLMVNVTFWSACFRNDLMTEGTFALVGIFHGEDSWFPAASDDVRMVQRQGSWRKRLLLTIML